VRVLYDWYGCTDVWVPNSFWRKLRSAGVEVRVVNPPSLYRGPRRFLARDHRKLVGVDGLYASVGGICIANGWLERAEKGYCRGHVRRLQVVLHADGYDVPLTPNARCAPVSPCTRRNRVRS
jgi:hypothetical protein